MVNVLSRPSPTEPLDDQETEWLCFRHVVVTVIAAPCERTITLSGSTIEPHPGDEQTLNNLIRDGLSTMTLSSSTEGSNSSWDPWLSVGVES